MSVFLNLIIEFLFFNLANARIDHLILSLLDTKDNNVCDWNFQFLAGSNNRTIIYFNDIAISEIDYKESRLINKRLNLKRYLSSESYFSGCLFEPTSNDHFHLIIKNDAFLNLTNKNFT